MEALSGRGHVLVGVSYRARSLMHHHRAAAAVYRAGSARQGSSASRGGMLAGAQAFWMLQSIVAGGVYFDEFRELAGWPAAWFSLGLVAALAGALGMGTSSFIAEQHAMISYSLLPGEQTKANQTKKNNSKKADSVQTLAATPPCSAARAGPGARPNGAHVAAPARSIALPLGSACSNHQSRAAFATGSSQDCPQVQAFHGPRARCQMRCAVPRISYARKPP